jgi:hypothetical protein
VLEIYKRRYEDMAQAISHEMGAPITWAREAQAYAGQGHMEATIAAAEAFGGICIAGCQRETKGHDEGKERKRFHAYLQ